MSPKPVITDRTIITTATPSITPKTDTQVITEATDRFGLRYFNARKRGKLKVTPDYIVKILTLNS